MTDWLLAYHALLDAVAINALLALSQYIVLRAGVFSIATAGLAAIGAYVAAGLVKKAGLDPVVGLMLGCTVATAAGVLLALPLARLRGVFQAIATLAFVQIVLSVCQNWTEVTDGALGLNGIPKWAGTGTLLVALACVAYVLAALGASRIGRAFDAIRQDETVAVALGIAVSRAHLLAFALSGFVAGLGGALDAFNTYSITPDQFGFRMVVAALAAVVLGGRVSVAGPIVGALILTVLPELARPFKDFSLAVHGALLIGVITFLPDGIVDTALRSARTSRSRRAHLPASRQARHGAPIA